MINLLEQYRNNLFDDLNTDTKVLKNVSLLIEENSCRYKEARKHLKKGHNNKFWIYELKNTSFDNGKIYNFLGAVNYIRKVQPLPLILRLEKVSFKDKMVMSILECICYYLIEFLNIDVYFEINIGKTIITDGIKYSAFAAKEPTEIKKYFGNVTEKNHFRRIVEFDSHTTATLSEVSTDIFNFLISNDLAEDTSEDLAEVLSEVVVNAFEHGKSDCFIDIDITKPEFINKNIDDNSMSYSVNVVVFNLSKTSFHTKLKKKMSMPELFNTDFDQRYEKVYEALDYHKQFFNENYTEDDFYTISSFQKGISGDMMKEGLGGFGLFEILKAIIEKSSHDYCYIHS